MRRRLLTFTFTAAVLLMTAPAAFAHDQGQGWIGLTDDKKVTNAGFILIIAFPLLVFLLSRLMAHLDKRKDARKKAAKARKSAQQWQGGW